MSEILHAQTIGQAENEIHKAIGSISLWGDLNYTFEEYEKLRECIKASLNKYKCSITKLAEAYPLSITTLMVFMARYKFNTNFWSLLGEELSTPMNQNHQSDLGNCAKTVFTRYGFNFSDCADDHWTNLAPIFYEAGIPPESCFDDLFFILSYDSHADFDSQLLIEDLLEARSYQIRKPMAKFLKRFRDDRAIDFVVDIHEAMLCVDQNKPETPPYASNYVSWKERQRSQEAVSARKKQEYQAKPYLSFDNTGKGLCIVLPRSILKDEWIDAVDWRITDERDCEIKKRLLVTGDEGDRFIPSITVPVSPSQTYFISLTDADLFEDTDIRSWTISGIPTNSFAYFNSNGRMISANYLTYPYAMMVLGQCVEITGSRHVSIVDRDYPTSRPGYRIVELSPEGPGASVKISLPGEEKTLRTKPQINISFVGDTLFGLPSGECSLFTEIPKMSITLDEEADRSDLELRVNGKVKPIDTAFENGVALFSLKSMCHGTFTQYGTYSIKLYQRNQFLKQAEFSYVPDVRSNYSTRMYWNDMQRGKTEKVFRFAKVPGFELEFDKCTVASDEEYYTVSCPSGAGKITVAICAFTEDNSFRKQIDLPIRPIEFAVKDSSGNDAETSLSGTLKLGIEDFSSNEYWLYLETFGEFKSGYYDLLLRTANGIEQKVHISLTRNGYANLNLSTFYDTLSSCMLPARLEICFNSAEEDSIPVLIVNDSVAMKSRPQYHPSGKLVISINDDGKNLTVKKYGMIPLEISLPYSSSKTNNAGNGIVYPCSTPLTNGLYVVECSRNECVFDFEDDVNVVPSNGRNTFFVSSRKIGTPVTCFSEWLDEVVQIIMKAGASHDLSEVPAYTSLLPLKHLKDSRVSSDDYEKLIALAYFAVDPKCLNLKKDSIRKVMQEISLLILKGSSRKDILFALTKLRCPLEVFDCCLECYNLFLLERDTADAAILAERIEPFSIELALLLRMGKEDTIRNTIGREKFREVIGKEAIRSLITVPDEEDVEIISAEIKTFLKEQSGSRVHIELSKELSGDLACEFIDGRLIRSDAVKVISVTA